MTILVTPDVKWLSWGRNLSIRIARSVVGPAARPALREQQLVHAEHSKQQEQESHMLTNLNRRYIGNNTATGR